MLFFNLINGSERDFNIGLQNSLKEKKLKKIQKQHRPEGKFFIPEKEALLPLFKCYAPVSFKSHQIKVIPYD